MTDMMAYADYVARDGVELADLVRTWRSVCTGGGADCNIVGGKAQPGSQ